MNDNKANAAYFPHKPPRENTVTANQKRAAEIIREYLPEPNDPRAAFVPEGVGWVNGESGAVVWTVPGGRIMIQNIEPGELTPGGAREFALSILAAANHAEQEQDNV